MTESGIEGYRRNRRFSVLANPPSQSALPLDADILCEVVRLDQSLDYRGCVVGAHRLIELGGIDTSTSSPFRQVLRPICFIVAPAVEHRSIDGFVDGGYHCIAGIHWLCTNGSIVLFTEGYCLIHAMRHFGVGVVDCARIDIAVDHNAVLEFKSVFRRFAHQPAEGNFREQVVLVTAANIGMGSYEPTLLDGVKLAGWVGVSLFWCTFHPKCGSECLPMLVDGKCMVCMRIVNPQVRFQKREVFTIDFRKKRKGTPKDPTVSHTP